MKKILQSLNLQQLKKLVCDLGEKEFRAHQILTGLTHGKTISALNVSPDLRAFLFEEYEDEPVKIIKTLSSQDGSKKYLFSLADGNVIEGVLMKYKYGNTMCVSTQVGCRMGCKFCASTLGGLKRNLISGEMLACVQKVNAEGGGKSRYITNVVLMGSGEPLDNYDEVVSFLKNLSSVEGLNISPRNISLSTCGIVPKIYDLARENIPLTLTISLHQTTDEGRARTMPVANKYKIKDILSACEYYFSKTGRRYVFEYSLIKGENSSEEHAWQLIKLLRGKPCHVNLIRLNRVEERSLSPVDDFEAYKFLNVLKENGISATLRRSLGADIGGACGQLRASYLKKP